MLLRVSLFLLLCNGLSAYTCQSYVTQFYDFEQSLNPTCGSGAATSSGAFDYTTDGAHVGLAAVAPNVPGSGAYIEFPAANIVAANGTVEFTYKTGASVAVNEVTMWLRGDGAASGRVVEHHVFTALHLQVVNNAGACGGVGLTPTVVANTQYYGAISWDATDTRFYVAPITGGVIGAVVLICTAAAPTWGTVANPRNFNENATDKWTGRGMDAVGFSNIKLTKAQLPSLLITNAIRNQYIRKLRSPKVGSWLPAPLRLLMIPNRLAATTQNQRVESRDNIAKGTAYNLKLSSQRFQDEVRERTRVTATVTRTPGRQSTATLTATRTPRP